MDTSRFVTDCRLQAIRRRSTDAFASNPPCSCSNSRELITGISVRATNTETINANEIVSARSRNRSPAIPGTNRIGKNTTSVVRVLIITGADTSCAPFIDESRPDSPSSRNRKMFSSTTTALSTTSPTASVSPDSEIIFKLTSAQLMIANVVITEIGIEIATISDVRPLRKKISSINITSTIA